MVAGISGTEFERNRIKYASHVNQDILAKGGLLGGGTALDLGTVHGGGSSWVTKFPCIRVENQKRSRNKPG